MYRSIALIGAMALTACGGGGGGGGGSPPVANQSVGGVWTGKDTNNHDIVALVTEAGEFHFLDATDLIQGFGIASVANGNTVTFNYTLFPPVNASLSDGSSGAVCTGSGSVQERQTLTISVNCTTTLSNMFSGSTSLTYDATYDRDSSLSTIAGLYDDSGDTFSIDTNGALFEQSASTGCVLNGQATVIDAAWNAYDVTFGVSSCTGNLAVLNGSTWDGIATLEFDGTTETLIAAFHATIQGVQFSIIAAMPQI